MTPAQIIALARDVLIVGVLVFVAWFLVKSGEDRVTVKNLDALQKQLQTNAVEESKWRTDKDTADAKLQSDLTAINSNAATPKPPVWVCRNPSGGPVPGGPTSTTSDHTGAGRTHEGPGASAPAADNVRPRIDALERKYETALAECRDVLASWPR